MTCWVHRHRWRLEFQPHNTFLWITFYKSIPPNTLQEWWCIPQHTPWVHRIPIYWNVHGLHRATLRPTAERRQKTNQLPYSPFACSLYGCTEFIRKPQSESISGHQLTNDTNSVYTVVTQLETSSGMRTHTNVAGQWTLKLAHYNPHHN